MLQRVADEHRLYLDHQHARPARGGKRKVAWKDHHGNEHDLDLVLEDGGSETVIGRPRGFIEIAWRRYTKHSRNKAQEIQGAVVPLAETFRGSRPFLGVVLAGVFTENSLKQLRSHGFAVVYVPYESVVAAFREADIDAAFAEDTPDSVLLKKVRAFQRLSQRAKQRIANQIRELHHQDFGTFLSALRATLTRAIKSVSILPLYGEPRHLRSIAEALLFIESFAESSPSGPFVRYEICVRYTNGDEVRGEFQEKRSAMDFLRTFTNSGHQGKSDDS